MSTSLTLIKPSWATPNHERSDPRTRCGHCSNYGWVIIKNSGRLPVAGLAENPELGIEAQKALFGRCEYGAPCPMCWIGSRIDAAQYGSKFWRNVRQLEGTVWENGLTHRHKNRCNFERPNWSSPCGLPAVDVYCNHHADPAYRATANNQRPVPIAQIAARSMTVEGDAMDPAAAAKRRERKLDALDKNQRLEQAGRIVV